MAPVGDSSSRAIARWRLPKVAAWSSLRAAWRSNLKPCASAADFRRSRCVSRSAMPSSGSKRMLSSRSAIGGFLPARLRRCNAVPKPWPMNFRTMPLLAAAFMLMPTTATAQPIDPKVQARIDRILKATPLIDGHNDIAEQLAENYKRHIDGLASGTDPRQAHTPLSDT